MGMFDIFTNKPTEQVPVQGATPPGNIPAPGQAPAEQQQAVAPPGSAPQSATEKIPESPLAKYDTLWETPPVDPNSPAAPEPNKALTVEEVQNAVASASFTDALNPETLSAIAAGGDEAVAALSETLNAVARQVMVQSTLVNNKLTEKAVTEALAKQEANLPGLLRSQNAADHMNTTNPLFNNPAIKPVIEATRSQLLQKNPNATAAELTEMTQNYIIAMGEAFAPAPINDTAAGTTDWDLFMQSPQN